MKLHFRTFGWIARQNPNIRISKNNIENDKRFTFTELSDKNILDEKNLVEIKDRKVWFKKGELWPTIILVEKGWDKSGTIKKEDAYIRIFRHEDGAILDILVGESLDEATLLAIDYKVPLFSVTCSRKGTRGTVQRIHMDIL